jgi:two-component system sensor histidine kinase QseC
LTVILGIVAWSSYYVARREAQEIFGARLATSARVLAVLVARQVEHATIASPIVISLPEELELSEHGAATADGQQYETKIAFQVWHGDGTLLARSASAPVLPFGPRAPGFSKRVLNGELWQVFVLRSGDTWIEVAEKNEVRQELVRDLGLAIMMPLTAGTLLLLAVVNLIVFYGLRPLAELTAAIERKDPATLAPIGVGGVPRELSPVVRALNDLLSRVNRTIERERRFVDAAAHELRTPLAALKIHAANAARAESTSERQQSGIRLFQGLDRLVKLAEQMLAYSRTQAGVDSERRVPVVVADSVSEAISALDPLWRAKSQRIKVLSRSDSELATILAEPVKVQRLIQNLLDNASRYGTPDSEIVVSLDLVDSRLILEVANGGPAVPVELRERVFEPYFRFAANGAEGSGLGLAIVKEITDQHGATVSLGSRGDNEGTVVRISFPLHEARYAPDAVAA